VDLLSLLSRASDVGRPGVRDILPVGSLVLLVAGLVAAGAPGHSPNIHRAFIVAQHLSVIGFGLLVLVIVATSIFLQPVISGFGALLQDNVSWVPPITGWYKWRRREETQRRLHGLYHKLGLSEEDPYYMEDFSLQMQGSSGYGRQQSLPDYERLQLFSRRLGAIEGDEPQKLSERLRRYPSSGRVRSTTLGSIIAAAEKDAGGPYGLDGRVALPRLELLLADHQAKALSSRRDDFLFALRFCSTLLLGAVASALLLANYGIWLLVPGFTLVFAWVSYRNAIAAATAYGEILRVVFDLYRFDLYRACHLPLPDDIQREKDLARALTLFLQTGVPIPVSYVYVQPGRPDYRS